MTNQQKVKAELNEVGHIHTFKNDCNLRSNQVSDAVCNLRKKGELIGDVQHPDLTKTYYIGDKSKEATLLAEYKAQH